ncbi:MAG TPA: hypothetical protein VF263_18525 [Longimicrobiaceae bacterium]
MRRTLLVAAGLLPSLSGGCAQVPANTAVPVPTAVSAPVTAPAAPAAAPVPAGFREMSFADFTQNRYVSDLPVRFRIPGDYVPVRVRYSDRTDWMSRADSAMLADTTRASELAGGFYAVQVSMNVGYDQDRRMFFSTGIDETTMAAEYEKQGAENVRTERWDVNGYPVLFLEAVHEGRRAAMVYVGALVETHTVFAYYTFPEVPGEVDLLRWKTLKEGLLASGPAVRIR